MRQGYYGCWYGKGQIPLNGRQRPKFVDHKGREGNKRVELRVSFVLLASFVVD